MHSGRYEDALHLAYRYTKLRPRDPVGWIYVNTAEVAVGSPERGLEAILATLAHIPRSTALRWQAAESLMSLGRLEEAEAWLNRLVQEEPEKPHGYGGLARLALQRGELEQAKEWARSSSRRIDPADVHEYGVLLSVASTLLALPGEQQTAERLFAKAAKQARLDPAPHLVLASLKGRAGDEVAERKHRADARACWAGSHDEFLREEADYAEAVSRATEYAEDEADRMDEIGSANT